MRYAEGFAEGSGEGFAEGSCTRWAEGFAEGPRSGHAELPRGGAGLILGGALLGALLLMAAEFTTLYRVRAVTTSALLESVGTGPNHAYALIPIALLAIFLGITIRRGAGRLALVGIGLAGVVALSIALLGDLPDARHQAHAARVGSGDSAHLVLAIAAPSTGLYLETLGAIVLIATCGSGLLLVGLRDAPEDRRPGTRR